MVKASVGPSEIPIKALGYRVELQDGNYSVTTALGANCVLTPSALLLLELADGTRTVEMITSALCAEFPDAVHQIRDDVPETIRQLQDRGLVDLVSVDYMAAAEREAEFRLGVWNSTRFSVSEERLRQRHQHRHGVSAPPPEAFAVTICDGEIQSHDHAPKRTLSFARRLPPLPPSTSALVLVTDFRDCAYGGADFPVFSHSRPCGDAQVILWPLPGYNTIASASFGRNIHQDDRPWEDKHPRAVWRGATTGAWIQTTRADVPDPTGVVRVYAPTEADLEDVLNNPLRWTDMSSGKTKPKSNRLQLVSRFVNDDEIDVGIARFTQVDESVANALIARNLLKEKKTRAEMLSYKYLIVVEGNDFASGLPWALYSNSLVLMPSRRTEDIVCRGLSEWQHYVPLAIDFSDAKEKLAWCRAHDGQCREIAQRATEYMNPFYDVFREQLIQRRVLSVYAQNCQGTGGPLPEPLVKRGLS